jgi:hypothetical protein
MKTARLVTHDKSLTSKTPKEYQFTDVSEHPYQTLLQPE